MLYVEMNVFCICILSLILYKVLTGVDRQNRRHLFSSVLFCAILFVASDAIWICIEGTQWAHATLLNYIVKAFYYLSLGICSVLWFLYSEYIQDSQLLKRRTFQIILLVPLLILIVLIIASFWTGWIFYIDASNNFHRGSLYLTQFLITRGYIAVTAAKALILAFRKENDVYRSKYLTLASFAIVPLFCTLLKIIFPEAVLISPGITFSLLYVYIRFQEQLISIDPLTQLNNRNQLFKFLSNKITHQTESKALYLLMMDIDYFKSINDQFGHIEGDSALIYVANTLKQICANENHFICRYGGDEFIIVCELDHTADVSILCRKINHLLAQKTAEDHIPYSLRLSIGYAQCTNSVHSVQHWIDLADHELYRIKRARK